MQGASNKVESQKEETCCVAGHRDIPADQMAHVKQELKMAVKAAIADGYRLFLTDFMEGTDQCFAEVVAEMMQEDGVLRLEAVLPYRSRRDELLADEKTMPLILACADISFTGEKYAPGSYTACRREQLKRSGSMIVVFDGRDNGGTIKAIRMAHAQEVNVREIPLGL